MITEKKNAQMQRKRKACRYVRNTRKGLRRLSGQTQKGYSEELPDDNADFTDRGGAFEVVRPNVNARALQVWGSLVRPETSVIGVYRRNIRSNKHQGRVHPNVTEVYVSIIDMMLGKDGPRQKTKKIGQTYNGFVNWYYKQSRKQRGGRLLR